MLEEWRPVVGYNGYEVSNTGRVRSTRRNRGVKEMNGAKGRYHTVTVRKNDKSGQVCILRHKLVLEAFVGPRPLGYQAAHLNGNPADNRVENLKWVTASENNLHKALHGTATRGERCSFAKLTAAQVVEIRRRKRDGETTVSLAKAFGVWKRTIVDVIYRHSWKDVA